MQKRLARKLDLEILLSKIEPHPAPRPNLEQYTISVDAAAALLYIAANVNDDILDKTVLDLGCGTGRLALGAAFLEAKEAVGVDIDRTAVKVASANSVKTNLSKKVQWIAASIDAVRGKFDTVLQNPPFGVQKRGADRKFLKKALELGGNVYSLHKSVGQEGVLLKKLKKRSNGVMQVHPSSFLKEFIERNGGHVKAVYALPMTVPHMFEFHTKKKHEFVVDLYVIQSAT